MTKQVLSIVFVISSFFQGFSQSFFHKLQQKDQNIARDFSITEGNFEVFEIDEKGLRAYLENTPLLGEKSNGVIIDFPTINGTMSFMAYESPCMMSKISAKYPFIKSYKLISVDNPSLTGRLSLGKHSVGGVLTTADGSVYFDPVDEYNRDDYVFYYARDQIANYSGPVSCGFTNELHDPVIEEIHAAEQDATAQKSGAGVAIEFRTYRMAISCTGEFGDQRTDGTIEDALSKLNLSVNRLNEIFEKELSIHVNLVNENDQIIWFNPITDPFPVGNSGFQLLQVNTGVINGNIGAGSYDWGHCYTSGCSDVGGVANRLLICDDGGKANGITCHSNGNMTAIAVSIAAHEMGHQMGANHSFNNCTDTGNENFGTGFEPGSGSTIMSYAGLCGSNNVQNTNDDYYHSGSLDEIFNFMRHGFGSTCAEREDRGNHTPDITLDYVNGFYIPIETPFELTGDATDEDGDELTFTWEQRDSSLSASPLGNPMFNAPLFRAYYPGTEKTRYFPRLDRILNNSSSNVEVLPRTSRKLNFAFVARDNNPMGGGNSRKFVRFEASDQAGPFRVTSQNNFESYEVGQRVTVEWDVANSDQAPVNAKAVDILLSTDGGFNFDYVLASTTPNDGSEEIFIPDAVSNDCRIKIKASHNIFFDINDIDFFITPAVTPSYGFALGQAYFDHCAPDQLEISMSTNSVLDYTGDINYEVVDLPADIGHSFANSTTDIDAVNTLVLDFSAVVLDRVVSFDVMTVSSAMDTVRKTVDIVVTANDFSALATVTPEQGATGIAETPYFEWVGSVNADTYTFQLSTSPAFEPGNTETIEGIVDEFINLSELLEKSTIYYWRVQPVNRECGAGPYSEISAFSTLILACFDYVATDLPKNISQSGLPTIESTLFVSDKLTIADVNVTKLKGLHEDTGDLTFSLISPEKTEITLVTERCSFQADFSCGFDDESASAISCSLNKNRTYRPEESLDNLDNEEAEGEWILRIKDGSAGAGGQFNEFELNICGGVNTSAPYLVKNLTLGVPTGERDLISNEILLSEDDNNTAEELIYTLVTAPDHGIITRNDQALSVGDQFTQADITDELMKYEHNGNEATEDGFDFTVIDGEGGWIEMTFFRVLIDDTFLSSTDDEALVSDRFDVFPVPATDKLFIIQNEIGSFQAQLFDQQGRMIESRISELTETVFDIENLVDGNYILKIITDQGIQINKVIKH